jgi:predicted Zn-dependent protease
MLGAITLGELQGITKEEQRKIAEQGQIFLGAGQLDDAYTVFRGLLALDPRDPYYHLAIGAIAQERKELEEAEHWYSSALHIRPRMGPAWVNRGEVRILTGRTKLGAEDLMKALELDPTDEHEWTIRARTILGALLARLDESKLSDPPSGSTDKRES